MNNNLNFKINHLSLFKFALPTMLANVFMSIYSTVDGIFVSNYVGTDALSAVNIFMPFVCCTRGTFRYGFANLFHSSR